MPLWQRALAQFRSLVVLLLLAASGIAWALGERAEAAAILGARSGARILGEGALLAAGVLSTYLWTVWRRGRVRRAPWRSPRSS